MRWFLGILVGFLAFVGVSASVMHYLREPYNPGFVEHPIFTALHVILGGLYLALAPLQFVSGIRSRWPRWHRLSGRLLVAAGVIIAGSAFFIAVVIPFSGWWERIINGFFAIFFFAAITKGFMHIRSGNMALHREWMIRAFAIGLAIATMRIVFIPMLIIVGDPTHEQTATLSIVSFTLAFVIHCTFAEWWLRRTRSRSRAMQDAAANA